MFALVSVVSGKRSPAGWLIQKLNKRRGIKLYETREHIVKALVAEIEIADGEREKSIRKRLGTLAEMLNEQGIREVLLPDGFKHCDSLYAGGLAPPDPSKLISGNAGAVLLGLLENPESSSVTLIAHRPSAELERTARFLLRRVRTLSVLTLADSELFAQRLRLDTGLSLNMTETIALSADAYVVFNDPGFEVVPQRPGSALILCDDYALAGCETVNSIEFELPERYPGLPGYDSSQYIAVLYNSGALRDNRLRVVSVTCGVSGKGAEGTELEVLPAGSPE